VNRFDPQPRSPRPAGTRSALTRPAVTRARLRAAVLTLAALTAMAVAAGCAAPATSPSPPGPAASGSAAATPASSASASPAASAGATCDVYASSLPPPLGPPQVTPGSLMATIRQRGHLVAGVDANTYHFEYFNPRNGNFEGFDIDMIQAVAHAIFGSDITGRIQYKALTNDERIPDVNNGTVDIVAHTYTITCGRLKQVGFSTVYFDAHRRVLVLDSSHANGLNDLGGQPVCVTTGSDAIGSIESAPSHPKLVTLPHITDCLVQLQQGQVAAICSDDSILQSLVLQDPYTKIVGGSLADEPYGLAISRTHPEFVSFVNAVLRDERTSGAWKASYVKWVEEPGGTVPSLPRVGYAS
jgi:polar amino acid transport system substrate-binding protein